MPDILPGIEGSNTEQNRNSLCLGSLHSSGKRPKINKKSTCLISDRCYNKERKERGGGGIGDVEEGVFLFRVIRTQ